jgi:glycerophosphoryl diester phosphodiesterase
LKKDAREPIPESVSGQTPDRSYSIEVLMLHTLLPALALLCPPGVFALPDGKQPLQTLHKDFKGAARAAPGDRQRPAPRLVAHRGLLREAPEDTLAAFGACLDLRLGFEFDVRRTRDGHLVVVHDDDVRRTTGGKGKVADLTLAELKKLDAGAWFDPAFTGQRIPTVEEVFRLLKDRGANRVLIAVDLKVDDPNLPRDLAALARKYGVTGQLVCIGRTISDQALRKRLREADPKLPLAVLAQRPDDLAAALADGTASWAYIRFVPTAEQVARAHRAGKRVFLVGPTVAGQEPANWNRAREAGVDALLTDHPLDCRRVWRKAGKP